ncbi:MAG: hypothetical protein AUK44_03205 [Porphyromonadaceae bacterium CG2_30_38_12]|nr:MAG: hypothetical protein AUK44_03205 [Porphyromonadaceae bacterium CG2_30_38_12]
MEITIVILLLIVGIVFFLLELFLIPGISLAGIAGTIFLGSSVYYAYTHISSMAGNITLLGGLVLLAIVIWVFIKSHSLDKMALNSEIKGKNDPLEGVNIQIGDKAITASRLAPMGKVRINGHTIEAKSNGNFIDENTTVRIIEIMKTNVLVEQE